MRRTMMLMLAVLASVISMAQEINVLPVISPNGGSHDDKVTITCTFPEGCAGGLYWINGGEVKAQRYTEPITLDYSCKLSVAGINKQGRIITDVVSHDFTINRVTPPSYATTPKEGIRKESFYVTKIQWSNVTSSDLDLSDFKAGGKDYGKSVVWLTDATGKVIASNDYNGLWSDGLNRYSAYIYKNYAITAPGKYVLHIAKGVFVLDGKKYDEELKLNYEISQASGIPEFTPEEGEYEGPLSVSISYPTDGTAFYTFYKLNGGKAKAYNGPITITETSTIEAYGMDEEFSSTTPVAKATYTIKEAPKPAEPLETPTMSSNNGVVTISAVSGATVKYWFDDKMSTAALYSAPFAVSKQCKISCVAYNGESVSETVDMMMEGEVADRGDFGEQTLLTPPATETMHLRALSPNGRFAVGYAGSDTSSKGFVWDLTSNSFRYQSTIFVNQLWDVSNDGTAYGWRVSSMDLNEDVTEDDLLWGICKDGAWTAQPKGFKTNGITADSQVYGASDGQPSIYDFTSKEYVYYTNNGEAVTGSVTAVSEDKSVVGGYAVVDGVQCPVIWTSTSNMTVLKAENLARNSQVVALSANGEWAIVGQNYRLHVTTGEMEYLISTSDRYTSNTKPEIVKAIANDGTIFGTFDASGMSMEKGLALVYTTDGRWRYVSDWILDEKGIDTKGYFLSAMCDITGDANILLMHAMSSSASSEDAFTRGLALRINVPVKHLAPISVKTDPIAGLNMIKVEWAAPITDADNVAKYTIYRDGQKLADVDKTENVYYDSAIEINKEYRYAVTATYADGLESVLSYESIAKYTENKYLPVRNLALRRAGLNDVNLTWDAPIVSLPKLQYFDEEDEWYAFGTGTFDAEFGIRIPVSDLLAYKGGEIRTFQFLPTGPHKAYTLNFYRSTGDGSTYDAKPFYSQSIDPATLNYGTVNTVLLSTPQALPSDCDLYVGLFIQSSGNDNMLGISYDGFKSGYSDLCRVDGVHDKMVAISANSSQATEIVLPLGIGICDDKTYQEGTVAYYEVTDNGEAVGKTETPKFKIENVSEGSHVYGVTATYLNGVSSEKVTTQLLLKNNELAYVPVDSVEVSVNENNIAHITWQAPLDYDRTSIHWGNLTPTEGWPLSPGFDGFTASAIYPVTMTSPYADEYEIAELFFCPMADVTYEVLLTDEQGVQYGYIEPEDLVLGEVNYLTLDNPVTVNPSINYQLVVNVTGCRTGVAPLAYDTSNKWQDGYSNLINYGMGLVTLSEIVQIGEHPNWLMGLVLRQKNAKPLPLLGYNVRIDGMQANEKLLTTNEFTSRSVAKGVHWAGVDVVYTDAKTVASEDVAFVAESNVDDAISSVTTDADGKSAAHDLLGRRVVTDNMGRGLYIIGKKVIKK